MVSELFKVFNILVYPEILCIARGHKFSALYSIALLLEEAHMSLSAAVALLALR